MPCSLLRGMGDEEECILITAFALGFYNLCALDCMRKGMGILWDVAQTEEYRQVKDAYSIQLRHGSEIL